MCQQQFVVHFELLVYQILQVYAIVAPGTNINLSGSNRCLFRDYRHSYLRQKITAKKESEGSLFVFFTVDIHIF